MKDYSVIARGDIKINQDVVSGTVISQNGSIFVGGNVGGSSTDQAATEKASSSALQRRVTRRPQIRAKGNFQALSLEEADVEAGGDINVTGDIRNCYIRTHSYLRITEGSLLGGKTYAVKGVEGTIIGSPHESSTEIYIVNDLQASARYAEMQQQIIRHKAAEKMVRLYLGPYHHPGIDLTSLEKHFREKIIELRHKLELTRRSISTLESLSAKLLSEQIEYPTFQLNFTKLFFTGSEIISEELSFSVDKELVGPKSIVYNSTQKMFGILDFQPLGTEHKDE